ncbi:MAG: class I SAM-dependent methyltransferase [Caldilineaceae bacterium]
MTKVMTKAQFVQSYASFGLQRSLRQIRHAFQSRQTLDQGMDFLLNLIQESECRMAAQLQKPVENLRMLEIGPGQGLERARYFGLKNEVIGIDLDIIPQGFAPGAYLQMLRKNGAGRVAKTLGRRLLIGRANEAAWAQRLGVTRFRDPKLLHGNICATLPPLGTFDVVMSWSVFEHLPDPRTALANVLQLLKPGGIFYLSLHLYTSHNGHHDIRAFTGEEDSLPLWGHLRPSTQALLNPSAYLNEWRLAHWRALFGELTPGYQEILEPFESKARFGARLTPVERAELQEFSDEELYTVNAVYLYQRPF